MIRLKERYKRIAIDFDGTIAIHRFPEIGEPKPHAVRVINKIKEHGGRIAIWTCRTGEQAEGVRKMLKDNGIPFDVFNEQFPEVLDMFPDDGRKIWADLYLDDMANFNHDFDWLWAEENLFEEVHS